MRLGYEDLKNIKSGDILYECEYGHNIRFKVKNNPLEENEKLIWVGITDDGNEINYMVTNGFMHYGPKIYTSPQYL